MEIIEFIRQLTLQVMVAAWGIFVLTWIVGWALRGAPIPITRVKKAGNSLIEDAIWAAFWLAMGGTIFSLISYIVSQIGVPVPEPPNIMNQTGT